MLGQSCGLSGSLASTSLSIHLASITSTTRHGPRQGRTPSLLPIRQGQQVRISMWLYTSHHCEGYSLFTLLPCANRNTPCRLGNPKPTTITNGVYSVYDNHRKIPQVPGRKIQGYTLLDLDGERFFNPFPPFHVCDLASPIFLLTPQVPSKGLSSIDFSAYLVSRSFCHDDHANFLLLRCCPRTGREATQW